MVATGRVDTASIVIAATPGRAYGAFATAEALMAWLPPADMTGRALEYDFREGGRYRIELAYGSERPASGAKTTEGTDVTSGRFVSLVTGERIVQTVEFESKDAAFSGEMTMTWTFEAVPEGTRVTVTAENVPSGISKDDHDAGLRSSLENLARCVGTQS
ncbi:MAG TPA: SRPBCC domain-containing protein [Polyangiaceae bacterium]